MNAPKDEILQRQAEATRLAAQIKDFRACEGAVIEKAVDEFRKVISNVVPNLCGYALETGGYKPIVEMSILIDLTPNKKEVTISARIKPPEKEFKGGGKV